MVLGPKCGGQDLIELEQHQMGYSEESEKKAIHILHQ